MTLESIEDAKKGYLGQVVDDGSVLIEQDFEQMREVVDFVLRFHHSTVVEVGDHLEGANVLLHL